MLAVPDVIRHFGDIFIIQRGIHLIQDEERRWMKTASENNSRVAHSIKTRKLPRKEYGGLGKPMNCKDES